MKKLFVLLVAPCIVFSTLSAQITQQEADDIVKQRLDDEGKPCTVYAKETVQTEGFTVITATGETLTLEYPCWVYYADYAGDTNGKYLIVKESSGNLLEVNTKKDTGPGDLTEWREVAIILCNVENPITDLPWLAAKIDEYIALIQDFICTHLCVYQYPYGNGQTGFFFPEESTWQPFRNCEGDTLCLWGGYLGETCPHLNIDWTNEKLIWDEFFIPPPPCIFDDPLEDLKWLKDFIESYDDLLNPPHTKIYQCTYREVGTGFIIYHVSFGYWILKNCKGTGVCASDHEGECDKYNIDYDSWTLIWEYKP